MPAPTTRHLIQLVPLTAPVVAPVATSTGTPSIPLDLYAEVTTKSGTRYRWGGNEPAGARPSNLSFRTKIGEGFSDASLQLARRVDFDYPDLNLVDTISLIGADGMVGYEGRLAAMPREVGDSHSIAVTLTGWMAHAKDRKFTDIYVDRDLTAWGPPSRARKIAQLSGNVSPHDPEQSIDPTDSAAGVSTVINGAWVSPYLPFSEAWYDAGPGNIISRIVYSWKREGTTVDNTNVNWTWSVGGSTDDKATSSAASGELRAAGPSALQVLTPSAGSTPKRYGYLQFGYLATPAGSDGARYAIAWYKIAVYGNHGLVLYTGESGEPDGVRASDVIENVAQRFCPLLDTTGVQDSDYVIQHLTFKDRTDPYDAFLTANKYHLWNLGVWENRRLVYEPFDLTDYDWEIRYDDPGTTIALQGPSTESWFNGIVVKYTDLLTGISNTLTPETNTDLVDDAMDNPWNEHGVQHWDEIELSAPTLAAEALQIGRIALADRNRPKNPGTITVRGYIRDRQGHLQPGWKVRAAQTIAVTNLPNDRPRLIHETSWDDESKTLSLSIDAPAAQLDAYFDRLSTGLTAKGLS